MQPNCLFASAEDAALWLQRKVDGRDVDRLRLALNPRRARAARTLKQAA